MRPTIDTLEQYLTDCETKRRRARDRPSNQVLVELRALLKQYHAVIGDPTGADDPAGEEDVAEGENGALDGTTPVN